jgi:5-formyltetrahydrofolate cyclo-ligase
MLVTNGRAAFAVVEPVETTAPTPMVAAVSGTPGEPPTKAALRSTILAARRRRPQAERLSAARHLRDRVLALPEVAAASTIAVYASLASEPGTGQLLSALEGRGIAVLLPVLQADRSLQWARHQPGNTQANTSGIAEPPAADADAGLLSTASVVVCPGVAGDLQGHRLGRGGGSYDRALAELRPGTLRCLLLYDDEVLDAVPTSPHDQPVDVIVTPRRTLRVSS